MPTSGSHAGTTQTPTGEPMTVQQAIRCHECHKLLFQTEMPQYDSTGIFKAYPMQLQIVCPRCGTMNVWTT